MKIKTTGEKNGRFITIKQVAVDDNGKELSMEEFITRTNEELQTTKMEYLFIRFINSLTDEQYKLYERLLKSAASFADKDGSMNRLIESILRTSKHIKE